MSRQEIYNTRLAHSRLSGECQLKCEISHMVGVINLRFIAP